MPACPQCNSFDTKSQDKGLGCLFLLICALAPFLVPIGVHDILTFIGRISSSPAEDHIDLLIQGIVALSVVAGLVVFFFVRKLSTDLMECKTCRHKWDQRKTPGKMPIQGMPF